MRLDKQNKNGGSRMWYITEADTQAEKKKKITVIYNQKSGMGVLQASF